MDRRNFPARASYAYFQLRQAFPTLDQIQVFITAIWAPTTVDVSKGPIGSGKCGTELNDAS